MKASARKRALCALLAGLAGCGSPERDNPADPQSQQPGAQGIELVATLPDAAASLVGQSDRLAEFRFEVSAPDMRKPLSGRMDLIGDNARVLVRGVPRGQARIFRVDVFDSDEIRTFAGAETTDVEQGAPEIVLVSLKRLKGTLELTSELPPEVTSLEVAIAGDGDTLRQVFKVSGVLTRRIENIPTGADVEVLLRGFDAENQILVERRIQSDIRTELLARLSLEVVAGSLHIVARFPPYIPIVEIDRFSDAAGTFFRRSVHRDLPASGAPIDFDDPRFLEVGFGPDGQRITFYNFDVKPKAPAKVYILIDRRDKVIAGQLPIFNSIPGESGYNDFWHIHHVRVSDNDYLANSLTSEGQVLESGLEIVQTQTAMNAVLVPPGSRASRRFDANGPRILQDGWYNEQIAKYLLFENPQSIATVDFKSGQLNTPQMYAFFDNNRDERDGFAHEEEEGPTHNVATRLPGAEGYSPLWVLQVFKLTAFDRVRDLASALDQARNEENKVVLPALLHLNAPVVAIE